MPNEDTYLVRLPKEFPLAHLAQIARTYGFKYRWSIHNDSMTTMRTARTFEIVKEGEEVRDPDTGASDYAQACCYPRATMADGD